MVSVVMRRQAVQGNRWLRERWDVLSVVPGAGPASAGQRILRETPHCTDLLFPGFKVHLHRDEAVSLYYILIAPQPKMYVVLRPDLSGNPLPFKVTACFDEAHAYLESDDDVRAVPMSSELIRWLEGFVLDNFVPEARRKRKRSDWRNSGRSPG